MIKEITISNYKIFTDKVTFSAQADLRTKYLLSNSVNIDNRAILKTSGIFGMNNSGKTSFTEAISQIKAVLTKGRPGHCDSNRFSDNPVSEFSIEFNNNDGKGWFLYEFSYDCKKEEFTKEELSQVSYYKTGASIKKSLFLRDVINGVYKSANAKASDVSPLISPTLSLLFGIAINEKDKDLFSWKNTLIKAGESIEVIQMYNIPIQNTIKALKGNNEEEKKAILSFVKNADLSIENYEYSPDTEIKFSQESGPAEKVLKDLPDIVDLLKLTTTYLGKKFPSVVFDSSGTKKIEAISSYIIEAFKNGKTLVIDELDNGLHFMLTRSIVSLFNNIANNKAQLFFTTHDVTLLDTKKLMRKEQIWFSQMKNPGASFTQLSSYTSRKGAREAGDLIKNYNRGEFGDVPNPDFVSVILDYVK